MWWKDGQSYRGTICHDERAMDKGVRTDGREDQSFHVRLNDRPSGRHGVGRGAKGCRDDDPITGDVIDVLFLEFCSQINHPSNVGLGEDGIVKEVVFKMNLIFS